MILAGDVGGTKTHLALFDRAGETLKLVSHRRVVSRDYPGLEAIVSELITQEKATVTRACFGVAGPVLNNRCEATNLPWVIDAKRLQRGLKLESVELMNDLEALAYGIASVPPSGFSVINPGVAQPHGAIAVIAAGTGLGEAALVWDGQRYRAMASEGGHVDFAPRTDEEVELFRYLRERYGRVSYERVLSGPGKVNIYKFLKDTGRGQEPEWLTKLLAEGDASAVISEMALARKADLCIKALNLFVSLYGSEAGNLALKVLATGGVYLGGGIAPTILPKLTDGMFMKGFTEKGRVSGMLSKIPVSVILEQKAALYGAARYATLPPMVRSQGGST